MELIRPEQAQRFPDVKELSADELKQAYELSKAEFTAADLQRYTEEEEGVSGEEILRRLEEQQQRLDKSR
jgi:hypothetical protein